MTNKTLPEVPVGMQRVYRRFERWRSSHQGRMPIPEALWASAAAVARERGGFRRAKILRLEYGKLKRMAESDAPARRPSMARSPMSAHRGGCPRTADPPPAT